MRTFDYAVAGKESEAIGGTDKQMYLAGGTTLLDLVKLDVMQPDTVMDINTLPLKKIEKLSDGRLKIGALVTNTDLARDPTVESSYKVLAEALLSGASTQLRNKATTGGNVMQKVRCHYFRDGVSNCNKREPGSGCAAIGGLNRSVFAVLGTSDQCIASHPSDMCVAMAAIGATVEVTGPKGKRSIDFLDFHRLPGKTPQQETMLEPGELITHVTLDAPVKDAQSHYLKLRDRASYQFALASSAVIVSISGGMIRDARIALGGVGTKPWRAKEAEQSLVGQPASEESFRKAAELAFAGAKAYEHNAFKIPLGKQAIIRSLMNVTSTDATNNA